METTKSRNDMLSRVLRILYVGVLLAHLIMWAVGVKGQGLMPMAAKPKYPVVESQRAKVKEIYTSHIGVREEQINSGVEVERYLRYVGLQKGNPWCAAFVCWTLGEAGVENPRSGWSPDLFKGSRVIWRSGASPESSIKNQDARLGGENPYGLTRDFVDGSATAGPGAGDVFGLYFPEKGRIAHVGFVDEWKRGWVTTVEGNTNVLGSREGDGVYRKRRLVRSIYKVARYVE